MVKAETVDNPAASKQANIAHTSFLQKEMLDRLAVGPKKKKQKNKKKPPDYFQKISGVCFSAPATSISPTSTTSLVFFFFFHTLTLGINSLDWIFTVNIFHNAACSPIVGQCQAAIP